MRWRRKQIEELKEAEPITLAVLKFDTAASFTFEVLGKNRRQVVVFPGDSFTITMPINALTEKAFTLS